MAVKNSSIMLICTHVQWGWTHLHIHTGKLLIFYESPVHVSCPLFFYIVHRFLCVYIAYTANIFPQSVALLKQNFFIFEWHVSCFFFIDSEAWVLLRRAFLNTRLGNYFTFPSNILFPPWFFFNPSEFYFSESEASIISLFFNLAQLV